MTKLKLGRVPEDKPVKLTVELPANLCQDLVASGGIFGLDCGWEWARTMEASPKIGSRSEPEQR